MEIVPLILKTKWSFPPTVPYVEIVNAILYKLKTGVQWNQLPVKALIEAESLTWNSIYYHYRKWCLSDFLKQSWIDFLKNHKKDQNLSCVDLDGSHTPVVVTQALKIHKNDTF